MVTFNSENNFLALDNLSFNILYSINQRSVLIVYVKEFYGNSLSWAPAICIASEQC